MKNNSAKEQREALSLYTKLMRATNQVTARIHTHLREDNLTVSQFAVLEALYHLGPLSQGELVKKILKSGANLTTVVDSLERKGLVDRVKSQKDRRRISVQLTEAGESLIARVFPRHAEITCRELKFLTTAEKKQLIAILRKFKNMDRQ